MDTIWARPLIHDSEKREEGAVEDDLRWTRFAESASPADFCTAWLDLQCRMIEGVACGLVLLGKPDEGPYTPIAVWPDPRANLQHLAAAAEKALTERRGLFLRSTGPSLPAVNIQLNYHVAYPILVSEKLHGVVVIDVLHRPDYQLQAVMRRLYWGVAWLENFFLRMTEAESLAMRDRLMTVLDLIASCVEQGNFRQAATAFVTEIAATLHCERVSYSVMQRNKSVRVLALSNSADFGRQMSLLNYISAAMEEAIDQGSSISFPESDAAQIRVTRAHSELANQDGMGSICTVPLLHGDKVLGAITLERSKDRPFEPQTIELCESLASLAGPILEEKRQEDRLLIVKAFDAFLVQAKKLFGAGHIGFKLSAILALGLIVFFAFAKGDYRLTADATIEGAIQRVIVAPFDGYVLEAGARAGDLVRKGQVMTVLDDRDLKLEHLKWASQHEQLTKKYREALAQHDRAQIKIISAQVDQAAAQIALIDEHLSRTRIAVPYDSIVISGDLSQSLGAPVQRGEVLFEVAPLDDYRVVLEVDEKDIDEAVAGQQGELVLSAMPHERLPFLVEKVTPVSTAKEGKNYFRVEATLHELSTRQRPGMEGVAKIFVDRRLLIWIWTHEIIDWLTLKLWSFWP